MQDGVTTLFLLAVYVRILYTLVRVYIVQMIYGLEPMQEVSSAVFFLRVFVTQCVCVCVWERECVYFISLSLALFLFDSATSWWGDNLICLPWRSYANTHYLPWQWHSYLYLTVHASRKWRIIIWMSYRLLSLSLTFQGNSSSSSLTQLRSRAEIWIWTWRIFLVLFLLFPSFSFSPYNSPGDCMSSAKRKNRTRLKRALLEDQLGKKDMMDESAFSLFTPVKETRILEKIVSILLERHAANIQYSCAWSLMATKWAGTRVL